MIMGFLYYLIIFMMFLMSCHKDVQYSMGNMVKKIIIVVMVSGGY